MRQNKKPKYLIATIIVLAALVFLGAGLLAYMGSCEGKDETRSFTEADLREADAVIDDSDLGKNIFLYYRDGGISGLLMDRLEFPKDLWKLFRRNPQLISFMLDYPEKRGYIYTDTIGSVKKGEIPLLSQWDRRWGYADFGDGSIADSGCAPTSLAMVVSGLTGNSSITPAVVCAYTEDRGYYVYGVGSSWSLISEGGRHFGIDCSGLGLSKDGIFNALSEGKPIICSMRKGDFTQNGHFIVLVGMEDGKIRVNDPSSRDRSEKLWTYERLQPQIVSMWVCSV